jgi:hypothetical protein
MYIELILHWAGGVGRELLDICALAPPLHLKEDGRCRLPDCPFRSLYVALRRRRVLYGLAVDTKEITTVARNSPIAF